MGTQPWVAAVQPPEETNDRARVALAGQAVRMPVRWQQLPVNVGQVGVGENGIGLHAPSILQEHPPGAPSVQHDLFHCRLEGELHPSPQGDLHQRLDDAVQAPFGIPDTVGDLGVGHHGEGRWRFEGAQPHVHVLKSKSGFQPRRVEKGRHVAVMPRQRPQAEQQRQVTGTEKLARTAKIAVDQVTHRLVVMAVSLVHVTQEALEAVRLYGFQLIVHRLHVGGERQLAAIVKDQAVRRVHPL